MKKYLLFIYFFLFSYFVFANGSGETRNAVNSLQEQYSKGYFIIKPVNNKLTVIGVSNTMTTRQDEITAAKEDAARKVAMYFGVQGSIESINRAGFNFFDFVHDSNYELNTSISYENYIENLSFDLEKDILITKEGVFIRFQYDTNVSPVNYSAKLQSGRPSWIRNQDKPVIDGLITSVGFSRNQLKLKDTIVKSAENAALTMIADLHTTVNTRETSDVSNSSSSFIQTRSEGKINNFQIIEIWIEPETRSVYTLAVGKAE